MVFNVSKETTSKELVQVIGTNGIAYDDRSVRMQTINFSAGVTNAAEFCQEMYRLPHFPELLKMFNEQQTAGL